MSWLEKQLLVPWIYNLKKHAAQYYWLSLPKQLTAHMLHSTFSPGMQLR